jgi:hypothetical protein
MKKIQTILLRFWRMFIVRTDAYILRDPYSRCKYLAIERYEECTFRGELLSSKFESICREFDIEIPSYQNGMTAGAFCQCYMSLRLSWVTTRSITVGKNTHSFGELPAPRSLSLAKAYIDRDLESARYWSRYLKESKQESQSSATKPSTEPELLRKSTYRHHGQSQIELAGAIIDNSF